MRSVVALLVVVVSLMAAPAMAQPKYEFGFGFVEYERMDTILGGRGFKGPFSVSLRGACESSAPTTSIRDRETFIVVGVVRCDNGRRVNVNPVPGGGAILVPAGVKTVFKFRVGNAIGQSAPDYIHIEQGIPGTCGIPPTVNVRNGHPTKSIRVIISVQHYQTGRVTDYDLTLRPQQIERSIFACAFGYSWVKSASFL